MKQILICAMLTLCSMFTRVSAQLMTGFPFMQVEDAPIGTDLVVNTVQLGTGINLEYAEQGSFDGTPVIFLHGLGDSWHSFETVFSFLPERIHAIAISQRGHGNSDRPAEDYTPAAFARDIAEFMKVKNLKSAFIAGHSMGGMIAQQFAISYPSLVRGLIIIDSDANFKDNPGFPEFYNAVLKMHGPIDRQFMDEFQRSTLFKPIDPDYYNKLVEEGMKVPVQIFKSVCTGMMNCDLRKPITLIKSPTLILWGDKDNFCSLADQQLMAKNIRESKLIVYENTGHALHWEHPERFGKDLEMFVIQKSKGTK